VGNTYVNRDMTGAW